MPDGKRSDPRGKAGRSIGNCPNRLPAPTPLVKAIFVSGYRRGKAVIEKGIHLLRGRQLSSAQIEEEDGGGEEVGPCRRTDEEPLKAVEQSKDYEKIGEIPIGQ